MSGGEFNGMRTVKLRGKEYETVKSRKFRFYEKFSDGRIVAELLEVDEKHALVKAYVYRNAEEQAAKCAFSTGHALEFKGSGANSTSWLENTEESAVGRALDNAGFASMMSCSYEEIVAAERNREAISEVPTKGTDDEKLAAIKACGSLDELVALRKTFSDSDRKLYHQEFTHRKGEVS